MYPPFKLYIRIKYAVLDIIYTLLFHSVTVLQQYRPNQQAFVTLSIINWNQNYKWKRIYSSAEPPYYCPDMQGMQGMLHRCATSDGDV